MENIITTLITGLSAIIGACIGTIGVIQGNNRKNAVIDARREQEQKDAIQSIHEEQIEIKKRLDTHNGYGAKFVENSKELTILNERQRAMKESLDKMQDDINYLKSDRCKV